MAELPRREFTRLELDDLSESGRTQSGLALDGEILPWPTTPRLRMIGAGLGHKTCSAGDRQIPISRTGSYTCRKDLLL
jgi:hypothetical protein